jgi:hypothetical protein
MSEGGAAVAALTERIKGETKKYRPIKASKFDISMNNWMDATSFRRPGHLPGALFFICLCFDIAIQNGYPVS